MQELRDQVEVIESWLKEYTQIDPSRVCLSVLDVMLWLAREAELQGKSWRWTLEHSRVHLASRRNWSTRTHRNPARRSAKNAAIAAEIQALPLLPASKGSPGCIDSDLARGYGLSNTTVGNMLRRRNVRSDEISPERARSHCLGRPQKRGQSNPKWHFIVPPPLPGPNKDQLRLPSI